MKNNAIIIILLLFLAITSFFWFQSLRIKDLPPVKQAAATPTVNGKEAEAFIMLAEEILVDYREPLPELYGKDPFYRERPVEQIEVVAIDPTQNLILSSIMYSDLHPLAVVNGMILAEGDTIYDRISDSDFMIESIEVEKVSVISGDDKYTLEKAHKADRRR